MNELEISHFLATNPSTRQKFLGVYAADELNISITKFPAFVIANTDTRNQGGKHWVCLYFNDNGQCDYFDSLGSEAKPEFIPFILRHSQFYVCLQDRIQDKGTDSCGLFCIDFAEARCLGTSFKLYVNRFHAVDLPLNEDIVYYKWCVSKHYRASVC